MKGYIKRLLREGLLDEEYDGHNLYGYHVTPTANLDNIKANGLKIGHRAMQGKGLYGFYDYDHAVRYAMKDMYNNNRSIVRFSVLKPERFLYLNMDIAKEVLGDEYHLMDQIEKYWYGGFNTFFEYVKQANPNITEEKLRSIINEIETNNTEMKQRTFTFNLLPNNVNDTLNIVWNGEYGLEYRINRLDYIDVDGYLLFDKNKFVLYNFDFTSNIPDTEEFKPLIDFVRGNLKIDSLAKAYKIANDALLNVRNNRDWDYYENILKLISKLKNRK